jgi:hypothetical protein
MLSKIGSKFQVFELSMFPKKFECPYKSQENIWEKEYECAFK